MASASFPGVGVFIPKEKLAKAMQMLSEGMTTREVSKALRLNFNQLKYIRKLMGIYVDVQEYEKQLVKLREEKRAEIQRLNGIEAEIEAKRLLLKRLEGQIGEMGKLKGVVDKVLQNLNSLDLTLYRYAGYISMGWINPAKWDELRKTVGEWRRRLQELSHELKAEN